MSHLDTAYQLGCKQAEADFQAELSKAATNGGAVAPAPPQKQPAPAPAPPQRPGTAVPPPAPPGVVNPDWKAGLKNRGY
jgi:hypothetical protein